jgi:Flp pilus assembly pilin Flp
MVKYALVITAIANAIIAVAGMVKELLPLFK